MNIKDVISREVDIPRSMIDQAISQARQQVRKFSIKIRNGDDRVILQPSKKLKIIQYWLIINVFEKIPVHDAALAYRGGKSILDNATLHKSNRYFLKLDFRDFFPSIKYLDLLPQLQDWYFTEKPEWEFNKEAMDLIRLACFFHGDSLAIGYPTSPMISNIVMNGFDVQVIKIVSDEKKYGEVVYTRYADDLIFSTNKQGVALLIHKAISDLVADTKSPKLEINYSKTKIGSSTGGTASVTGLKICTDGHITVHRNQKDHVRLLLSLYKKDKLNPEEYSSLLGHLAYLHQVDSTFYTKLQNKFFKEIAQLRAQSV